MKMLHILQDNFFGLKKQLPFSDVTDKSHHQRYVSMSSMQTESQLHLLLSSDSSPHYK